ncbi:hypothetical protein PINS_up004889 [Pythium insidiosum]|nr:hypothetical protein PINS_up004889 [Pythium insidiosum]
MSAADFFLLKQHLCRFFQDTRIKVSLFLQNGIQGADGTLMIRYDGLTATGGRVPGTIRYFDDEGTVDDEERFSIASAEDSTAAPDVPVLDREQRNTQLGYNMYEADAKGAGLLGGKSTRDLVADAKRSGAKGPQERKPPGKTFKATASDGLNLLAELLGATAKEAAEDKSSFRLNLFPDDSAKGGDDDDDSKSVPTIWIDATSERKEAQALADDFGVSESAREGKSDQDDLLKLMDSTT